jgi:hypothetical protein
MPDSLCLQEIFEVVVASYPAYSLVKTSQDKVFVAHLRLEG